MTDLDRLDAWHYDLPPELIASRPAIRRDAARLMVLNRARGTIEHAHIHDLPEILSAGDLLIFNNTRVVPARLFGFRTATQGKWEGLFLETQEDGLWEMLCETRGKLQPGETITIIPAGTDLHDRNVRTLTASLVEKREQGSWLVRIHDPRPAFEILEEFGSLPLPPYMGRRIADDQDRDRYQTHFASVPGAVAAPTAGLHFTPELLAACQERGIGRTAVTLHTGIGTFRPVSATKLSEHQMHYEWCRLPSDACVAVHSTRTNGGRVLAVGTTSVRTLEAAAAQNRAAEVPLQPWQGRTNLFIRPGYQFRVIDGLLTNFHLPGSTLLVLVATLAGYEFILEAYRRAIEERYRFYSYGDAMLIL